VQQLQGKFAFFKDLLQGSVVSGAMGKFWNEGKKLYDRDVGSSDVSGKTVAVNSGNVPVGGA
jgi:hypothetical protein